ncbi:hypothetical protein, partial [Brevundimonas sp.]|uniref:hypothetical protein n=1 Tax=Brevundimonas sp. TaxID=1871086 RepID=UPI0025E7F4CE
MGLFPAVDSASSLSDLLARVHWYLGPVAEFIDSIRVSVEPGVSTQSWSVPDYLDASAVSEEHSGQLRDRLRFEVGAPSFSDFTGDLDQYTHVLVWRTDGLPDTALKLLSGEEAAGRLKVYQVDRNTRQTEGSRFLSAALDIAGGGDRFLDECVEKFGAYANSRAERSVNLFGTGPSLSEVKNYRLSGDNIVCNSLIKNDDLMDYIQPSAMAAADPIFHAGVSRYAGAFRRNLVTALRERDITLFVPMRDYVLYRKALPAELFDRVIGVPFAPGKVNYLDLKKDFCVAPHGNVLTLLLLPIAGSLYEEIRIAGCDGKREGEDAYFWSHHAASQYVDEMEGIQRAHPGFFNISYGDYYKKHLETLGDMLDELEGAGKTVQALTSSFMLPLRRRGAPTPLSGPIFPALSGKTVVLSLNPDAADQQGHFWAYESKLAPIVKAAGLNYRIASGGPPPSEGLEAATVIEPTLSVRSWSLGVGAVARPFGEVREEARREFELAVERALRSTSGDVITYMYTGSLEHLGILAGLVQLHPRLRVVLNLFWFRAEEAWTPDFETKWGQLLRWAADSPRVCVSVMTAHQGHALKQRLGLDFAVAPHPSPLLGDEDAEAQLASTRKQLGKSSKREPVRVLLPGAPRKEKGGDVAADTLRIMLGDSDPGAIVFVAKYKTVAALGRAAADHAALRSLPADLTDEVFAAEIAAADVVVLPYMAPDFANRTSGLLIDALYSGSAMVVVEGTWLASCVRAWGNGVVAPSSRPRDLARAIREAVERRREFKKASVAAAAAYFTSDSWASLANYVIDSTKSSAARESAGLEEAPILGEYMASQGARLQVGQIGSGGSGAVLLAGHDLDVRIEALRAEGLGVVAHGGDELEDASVRVKSLADRSVRHLSDPASPWPSDVKVLDVGGAPADQLVSWLRRGIDEDVEALIFDLGPEGLNASAADEAYDLLSSNGWRVLLLHPARWTHPAHVSQALSRITLAQSPVALQGRQVRALATRRMGDARELREWLLQTSPSLAFEEENLAFRQDTLQWARCGMLDPDSLLAEMGVDAKAALNGMVAGEPAGRFAVFAETDQDVVHRVSLPAVAEADRPLVATAILGPCERRFISLWVTASNLQPAFEATFDLVRHRLVSTRNVTSADVTLTGGLAAYGADDARLVAWIAIEGHALSGKIFAHIVPRLNPNTSAKFQALGAQELRVQRFTLAEGTGPARHPSDDIEAPARSMDPAPAMATPTATDSAPSGPSTDVKWSRVWATEEVAGAEYRHLTIGFNKVAFDDIRLEQAVLRVGRYKHLSFLEVRPADSRPFLLESWPSRLSRDTTGPILQIFQNSETAVVDLLRCADELSRPDREFLAALLAAVPEVARSGRVPEMSDLWLDVILRDLAALWDAVGKSAPQPVGV